MARREVDRLDWLLWFLWIMATAWGWILGRILFPGIYLVAAGVGVAALQWLVLRPQLTRAGRWLVYTTAGWAIGALLAVVLGQIEGGSVAGLLLGATTGFAQWLVLRREKRWAGWWIPISAMGWSTGLSMALAPLLAGVPAGALTGLALVLLPAKAADPDNRSGRRRQPSEPQ